MAEYEDWSRETMKVTFCHIFFCWSHFCRAIFTSHFLLLVTFLISPHISRRTHLNFQWSTLRRGHLEGREPAMPGTRILKDTIGPSGPQIASPIGQCWFFSFDIHILGQCGFYSNSALLKPSYATSHWGSNDYGNIGQYCPNDYGDIGQHWATLAQLLWEPTGYHLFPAVLLNIQKLLFHIRSIIIGSLVLTF